MTFYQFQKGGALLLSNTALNFWPHKKYLRSAEKKFGVGILGAGRSKSEIFEASSEAHGVEVWPPMVRSRKKGLFFGQSRLYNDFGLKTGIGCAYLDPVGV